MDVTSVTAAGAISDAAQSRATLAGNFDTFLKLLTTQLQNQDPLEPLNSNEFTQQLVQFTSVEQQIAANENLEKILAAMRIDQTATALGFLGKQVEAETDTTGLPEGGSATWTYRLPSSAARVVMTVTDATGKLVYVGEGEKTPGAHAFVWDGKDNAGGALPPGSYTLAVAARDAGDGVVEAEIGIRGVVSGATTTKDGEAAVLIGGTPVPLSAVSRVTEPAAAPGTEPETAAGSLLDALNDIL
jgi:flagellar basal-body rod modification protein FlgD